jgi:hypothetical protein
MLDGRVAAFRRRGVELPPPMVVADSWFSDSKLMRHVAAIHDGTLLVEGKSTYVFALADGRQVKGEDLQHQREWPWRHSPQVSGRAGRCRGLCRYRDLLDLKVHVRIPALEDGPQFPVERPHARL